MVLGTACYSCLILLLVWVVLVFGLDSVCCCWFVCCCFVVGCGFMLVCAVVVCDCAFTSCGCVLLVCLVCVFEFDILTTFTGVYWFDLFLV